MSVSGDNILAQKLLSLVGAYSRLPEALLISLCRKHLGKRLSDISKNDIPTLARFLGQAIGRNGSQEKGEAMKKAVYQLIREATPER